MNGHPQREEDFDLYALGVLEGEDRAAIESHLASCPACARKLSEARGRISLLALAAPQISPSPGLKEQLLRQIHTEDSGPRPAARPPVSPAPHPGFFSTWRNAALGLAAVAAVLAAIFIATENVRLRGELDKMHASLDSQQKQLNEARAEAEMFESRETRIVALAPMPGHPMTARVLYNSKMGMVMADVQAPAAPEKMNYQLWLLPKDGPPISAGVFNTSQGGGSMFMADVPKGTEPLMFSITVEPEGGMPHPTGPTVMTAKIL